MDRRSFVPLPHARIAAMHGHQPGTSVSPLETLLRLIADKAPEPWYPRVFAQTTGVDRDSLDAPLEQLRQAGLVQFTDWVPNVGQGYALTPQGEEVLQTPSMLAQLREGRPRFPARPDVATRTYAQDDPNESERIDMVDRALEGAANPYITRILLWLNIAVFAYGLYLAVKHKVGINGFLTNPPLSILQLTGAVGPDLLLRGEWWRLLTCCFVHGGLIHLGVNMYSLWAIGPLVEKMWGRARYLTIYLITGFVGSCVAMLVTPVMLVGASGALWGILGALMAWILLNRRYIPSQLYSIWMRQLTTVVILNAAISFMVPGISASAHFGGGAAGVVAAVFLHLHRFGPRLLRPLALVGLAIAAATPLVMLVQVSRHDEHWQKRALELGLRKRPVEPPPDNPPDPQGGVPDQQIIQEVKLALPQQLIPMVREACESGETAIRQANPLINKAAKERPKDAIDVRAARENLARAAAQLNDSAEAIRQVGELENKNQEKGREALLKYTTALRDRCQYFQEVLQGERVGPAKFEEYDGYRRRVDEARGPAQQILQ